jgi:hypothetical protein
MPAMFMCLMNNVFQDELDHCVLIYLDDILIFSPLIEQHLCNICTVLKKLQQHWLYAKLTKCKFLQSKILFLGHHINAKGLQMDPEKIRAILEWPNLKSKTDVLSFLGLVNFYHKHLKHLTEITTPLSNLLKDQNPFIWGPDQVQAFQQLKKAVTNDLVLCHFAPANPIKIHCDASNKAIGATMIQNGCPVAFKSWKLSAAKLNDPMHDKELLTIVHALTKWCTYLHSSPVLIKILTDNASLKYLVTQLTLSHRQAHWLEKLAEYNYNIEYTPGPMNIVPDALS